MRFDNILIEEKVKEKILSKHNVKAEEIVNILNSKPLVLKARIDRYIAIGQHNKYLTIILERKEKLTKIITAYPSSPAQIRLFKKKKKL